MTNRTQRGVLILALVGGLTGCGGSAPSLPTAPSTITPPPAARSWPSGALHNVTLSGTVYELTATGRTPIEGVTLYCELCGEETHSWAYTDPNGFYQFTGVWVAGRPTSVHISKDGYGDPAGVPAPTPPNQTGAGWRETTVNGDTIFDVELVKQ